MRRHRHTRSLWLMGVVLIGVVLSSGCSGWRVGTLSEVQTDTGHEQERLLVVTKDRAFEVELIRIDATTLHGRPKRAWKTSSNMVDPNVLDDLNPDQIAEVLGWEPIEQTSEVELDRSEIQYTRRFGTQGGRSILAVGIPVGTLVTIGAVILSLLNHHSSCGRPLRVRGRQCITPVTFGTAWIEPIELAPVPENVRKVLAEIWTEEAQAEHAAVAAFSKLSLELLALGAPPELVTRANRAALQEVQHARLCFGVASAYVGRALGPAPLPEALEGDTTDLARLAREALVDGCMREGLAAEIARIGSETACDPALARVLRIQAREEAQHAALGWAIVEWSLLHGGDSMRGLLVSALADAKMPRCDDLPAHGRVSRAIVKPLFDDLRARTRERLAELTAAAA